MKRLLSVLSLPLALLGGCHAGDDGKMKAASCFADLPWGTPEKAAHRAFEQGDLRIYVYGGAVGDTATLYMPGLEDRIPFLPSDRQSMGIPNLRDESGGPLQCTDCDYPMTRCGPDKIAWATRYNVALCNLAERQGRQHCGLTDSRRQE